MAVEVTDKPDPRFPDGKKWSVMDDGLCYQRYDTKEEADVVATGLRVMYKISDRAEQLVAQVQTQLMREFELSNVDANLAITEAVNTDN